MNVTHRDRAMRFTLFDSGAGEMDRRERKFGGSKALQIRSQDNVLVHLCIADADALFFMGHRVLIIIITAVGYVIYL